MIISSHRQLATFITVPNSAVHRYLPGMPLVQLRLQHLGGGDVNKKLPIPHTSFNTTLNALAI